MIDASPIDPVRLRENTDDILEGLSGGDVTGGLAW
jgi:hypothetical protein